MGRGDVARSKTTRGEGLVPRWGRGGGWRNPPCQFTVPIPRFRHSGEGRNPEAGAVPRFGFIAVFDAEYNSSLVESSNSERARLRRRSVV